MASASCKLGLFLYLGEREIKKAVNLLYSQLFFVGLPGFEPGMTGPESVVLPLHHSPITGRSHFAVAKIQRI